MPRAKGCSPYLPRERNLDVTRQPRSHKALQSHSVTFAHPITQLPDPTLQKRRSRSGLPTPHTEAEHKQKDKEQESRLEAGPTRYHLASAASRLTVTATHDFTLRMKTMSPSTPASTSGSARQVYCVRRAWLRYFFGLRWTRFVLLISSMSITNYKCAADELGDYFFNEGINCVLIYSDRT